MVPGDKRDEGKSRGVTAAVQMALELDPPYNVPRYKSASSVLRLVKLRVPSRQVSEWVNACKNEQDGRVKEEWVDRWILPLPVHNHSVYVPI